MKTINDFLRVHGEIVSYDEKGRMVIGFPNYCSYLRAKEDLVEKGAFGKSISAFDSIECKIYLR